MWWTAITLAGVAAWFEWTYRRSRKIKGDDKKASEIPETATQEQLELAESIGSPGPASPPPHDAQERALETPVIGSSEEQSL